LVAMKNGLLYLPTRTLRHRHQAISAMKLSTPQIPPSDPFCGLGINGKFRRNSKL
jgi:hypothetical protein